MNTYVTVQGDMVDRIAWAMLPGRAGAAEAILAANPGLADRGPVLPANLVIQLPDLPPPAPRRLPTVDLWT